MNFSNEKIVFKLNNEIEVHLISLNTEMTYINLSVPFGHFNERITVLDEEVNIITGSPHFLEHIMFQTKEGDALTFFAKAGFNANAETNYEFTNYSLVGHKNIVKGIEYLINMCLNPAFDQKKIEHEINIIEDEINYYVDHPFSIMFRKLASQLLYNHPLLIDILGTKSDIAKQSFNNLKYLHSLFYQPHLMKLVVMGPFKSNELKENLSNIKFMEPPKIDFIINNNFEPANIIIKEDTIDALVDMPVLLMGFKYTFDKLSNLQLIKTKIVMDFLSKLIFGKQTDFINNLILDELIFEAFEYDLTISDKLIFYIIITKTENPDLLKDHIKNYLKDDALNNITSESLELIKNSYLGSYIMEFDDFEYRLSYYSELAFKAITFDDVINVIKSIDINDIYSMYYALDDDLISFLTVLPKA